MTIRINAYWRSLECFSFISKFLKLFFYYDRIPCSQHWSQTHNEPLNFWFPWFHIPSSGIASMYLQALAPQLKNKQTNKKSGAYELDGSALKESWKPEFDPQNSCQGRKRKLMCKITLWPLCIYIYICTHLLTCTQLQIFNMCYLSNFKIFYYLYSWASLSHSPLYLTCLFVFHILLQTEQLFGLGRYPSLVECLSRKHESLGTRLNIQNDIQFGHS